MNEKIQAPEVFLVDENKQPVGTVSREQALQMARAAGLDLVEISPKAQPPVCKIIDYGKHKYELEKQAKKQRAKNKGQDQKEIRLSLNIEENDLQVKAKKAREFLEKKHKVKITLRLKGREMAFSDKSREMLDSFYQRMKGRAKIESEAKRLGRQWQMTMAPDPDWSPKKATKAESETAEDEKKEEKAES
ncbi:translation initiation factor IF-3 [Patescibacteria group bacterium]|nr:translation initiation factor IF-3 [Patescibacteria group bacterium]